MADWIQDGESGLLIRSKLISFRTEVNSKKAGSSGSSIDGSGSSGISNLSGLSGSNGTSGSSGENGTHGISGSSGIYNGTSGSSGSVDTSIWKISKSLITQMNEDTPVVTTLNETDKNYLFIGDPNRDSSGIYYFRSGEETPENLTYIKIANSCSNEADPSLPMFAFIDASNSSRVSIRSMGDGVITKPTYLEVGVRQRGTAPVLLSGATNVSGNIITLTFDTDMTDFFGWDGGTILCNFFLPNGGRNITSISRVKYSIKLIELALDLAYTSYDTIFLTYTSPKTYEIESTSLGILSNFIDFPIQNNTL